MAIISRLPGELAREGESLSTSKARVLGPIDKKRPQRSCCPRRPRRSSPWGLEASAPKPVSGIEPRHAPRRGRGRRGGDTRRPRARRIVGVPVAGIRDLAVRQVAALARPPQTSHVSAARKWTRQPSGRASTQFARSSTAPRRPSRSSTGSISSRKPEETNRGRRARASPANPGARAHARGHRRPPRRAALSPSGNSVADHVVDVSARHHSASARSSISRVAEHREHEVDVSAR